LNSERSGARQPQRFDPARAHKLLDPEREEWLPSARIISLLALESGMRLLDFGTGSGALAVPLARAHPGVEVWALDEQPRMLERLRDYAGKPFPENLHPILPDELHDAGGRFERVLAVNLLHELGDAALATLTTQVRTGGFALVIDWDAETERPVGPPADHVFSASEAETRLAATGLLVESIGGFAYHYAFICRATGRGSSL
jgi:2-polyprenyl-3-methyl-5-hydroxy-6-metoxy-1,4-benzoquinol methylase